MRRVKIRYSWELCMWFAVGGWIYCSETFVARRCSTTTQSESNMGNPPFRTIHVPMPTNPEERRKMIDIKNHITEVVKTAASVAMHQVRAEELRLAGLGHKIAGPFERLMRAVRAGLAAFKAVMKAQS